MICLNEEPFGMFQKHYFARLIHLLLFLSRNERRKQKRITENKQKSDKDARKIAIKV